MRRIAKRVERPDRLQHRAVMGVEQMGAAVARAGEMDLDDALGRQRLDIMAGVEAVVEGADIDVVDVEQQAAIGVFREPAEILPFRHLRAGELEIGAGIFEDQRPPEPVLDRRTRATT